MKRRLFAMLGMLALVFLALPTSSASADGNLTLHNGQGSTAGSFTTQECTTCPAGDGQDSFHFVLNDSLTFTAFSATYTLIDGTQVTYTLASPNVTVIQSGKGLCVLVPSGATLVTATASYSGSTANPQLLLSHTCVGTPPPAVPEAPYAVLIPLTGLLVVGGAWAVRRRRSTRSLGGLA